MFCQVALIHVPKFGEVRRVTAKAAEATELLLRCARADLNVEDGFSCQPCFDLARAFGTQDANESVLVEVRRCSIHT